MPEIHPLMRSEDTAEGRHVRTRAAHGRHAVTALLRSARPHQWLKNLFVLAPLLFGQKLGDVRALGHACLACAGF